MKTSIANYFCIMKYSKTSCAFIVHTSRWNLECTTRIKQRPSNHIPHLALCNTEPPTSVHVATSELVDTGERMRRASMDTNHVEVISGAFHDVTLNILIITLFIPVWVKSRFTTGGPLNAVQLMTSSTVESSNKMA